MQALPRVIRPLTALEIETLERDVTSVEKLDTRFMEPRVFDMSLKADADGDARLAGTYRFLSGVLYTHVEGLANINASDNPLSVTPASLSDDEIHLLAELTTSVKDPELRSRLADFLWTKTRNRKYGEMAVDDYLASALRLRDPHDWTGPAPRYERAVTIAASLGKKNARYAESIAIVEDYLAELDGADTSFLSERLMTILLNQKEGDRLRYAKLAAKCASAAELRGNFYLALHYWDLQRQWYVALNDTAGQQQARIAAAECVIKDGESRLAGEQPNFVLAADFLHNGMVMLIKAGAPQDRVDELAIRLKEYQRKSLAELKTHSVTLDVSEMTNAARKAVAGKSLPDAITAFIGLIDLPDRATVRRQILERAKMFVFTHLFGETKLSPEGAPLAGRGSVSGDEATETPNVLALMFDDVTNNFSLQGQVSIQSAWRQIQDEHDVRERDMSVIVQQSWFVPPTHEVFFSKGLAAGFEGDLVTAIHLLVPHVEGAIRWNLQRRGVTTMRPNKDGYHEEQDLNQLLRMPETKTLLGDRLHFALTALLTSRFGYNLRNNLAHSLVGAHDCYSTVSLFFWSLMLMICVQTIPQPEQQARNREAGD